MTLPLSPAQTTSASLLLRRHSPSLRNKPPQPHYSFDEVEALDAACAAPEASPAGSGCCCSGCCCCWSISSSCTSKTRSAAQRTTGMVTNVAGLRRRCAARSLVERQPSVSAASCRRQRTVRRDDATGTTSTVAHRGRDLELALLPDAHLAPNPAGRRRRANNNNSAERP